MPLLFAVSNRYNNEHEKDSEKSTDLPRFLIVELSRAIN